MQQEHGNYQLMVEGRIIHNYPVGGFNAEGIKSLTDAIVDIAPANGHWALFEHPKVNAGLTPDGVEAIKMMYEILIEHGCVAIALEIGFTFGNVLERKVLQHLVVPTMTGLEEEKIEAFLTAELDKSKQQHS